MAFHCRVDHEHHFRDCLVALGLSWAPNPPPNPPVGLSEVFAADHADYDRGFSDGWDAARKHVASEGL